MNILIIGSGGREHALAWKIKQSIKCKNLFVIPGNAGTHSIAVNINLPPSDFRALGEFALDKNINMVLVGPEAPLVDGIRDYFKDQPSLKDILFIGPGKTGARLEGSKDFAKQFMSRHNIPTAKSGTFNGHQVKEALNYVADHSLPVVLKADGLAAGKGVIICNEHKEARETVLKMLEDKMFGSASSSIVIEEFLSGIELSVFVLTDGENYVILPEAKDYKRIGENDSGLNTGGMGAVSPVKFADEQFMKKVEERIVKPTIDGIRKENIEYCGFLFIGLMNRNGDPYVIEYNVRMGDPETQVVMPRLNSDLVDLLESAARKNLHNSKLNVSKNTAVTVVLASEGYPGPYEKGRTISGLDRDGEGIIFHAGTVFSDDHRVLTAGGRVLAVTGMGKDIQTARQQSYNEIKSISWPGMQFRHDIGMDLLKLE